MGSENELIFQDYFHQRLQVLVTIRQKGSAPRPLRSMNDQTRTDWLGLLRGLPVGKLLSYAMILPVRSPIQIFSTLSLLLLRSTFIRAYSPHLIDHFHYQKAHQFHC